MNDSSQRKNLLVSVLSVLLLAMPITTFAADDAAAARAAAAAGRAIGRAGLGEMAKESGFAGKALLGAWGIVSAPYRYLAGASTKVAADTAVAVVKTGVQATGMAVNNTFIKSSIEELGLNQNSEVKELSNILFAKTQTLGFTRAQLKAMVGSKKGLDKLGLDWIHSVADYLVKNGNLKEGPSTFEAGVAAVRRIANLRSTLDSILATAGSGADATRTSTALANGDYSTVIVIAQRRLHDLPPNSKAASELAQALKDLILIKDFSDERGYSETMKSFYANASNSMPARLAKWSWSNPVSTTIRTNSTLHKVAAAAFAANLIRDHYHYYLVLNTESIEKKTPRARATNSMTNRASTVVRMLHSFNSNTNNTKAQQEKLKEVRDTLLYDISVGQVTIRDRFTDEVINVEKEGAAKALDEENIAYTIDGEMKEVQSIIDLTESYNYEIDIAEDVYQRGFKYDFGEACKAVPVGKGTQYYDYTTEQAAKLDAGMKEDEGLWKALRVSKYNIPVAVYPSRLPYYMQPSRWIISYGMPFTYKRAKRTWWSYTKKKWFLDSIRKLLLVDPRRNDVGPAISV